jgi:hypothetical protein
MQSNKTTNVILGVIALALVILVIVFFVHSNSSTPVAQNTSSTDGATTGGTTTSSQSSGGQTGQGNTTSGSTPTPIAVAGMQQYTDTTLGFSFWYPSSWSVIANPPLQYAPVLSGGTVVKTIVVGLANSPTDGITISDFVSSGRSITDDTNPGPAGDTAHVIRYYFDVTSHTWMMEDYPTSTSQTGTVTVADISANSMGGLHVLRGNARFGNDVILPLSANHFVVVSGTSPGGIQETYLANTVVAADPSVATPVSNAQQIQTIQAEMSAYTNQTASAPAPTPSWQSYTDPNSGITIQYPSVNGVSLKPSFAVTPAANIDTQGCLPGQLESGAASPDTVMTIHGTHVCQSESTDSGMGHHYDVYYDTFLYNGNYYTLTYDASTVNCGGYGGPGDPGYQTCQNDTAAIALLVPYIHQSLSTLVL